MESNVLVALKNEMTSGIMPFEVVINDELPREVIFADSDKNAEILANDLFGVNNWLELYSA